MTRRREVSSREPVVVLVKTKGTVQRRICQRKSSIRAINHQSFRCFSTGTLRAEIAKATPGSLCCPTIVPRTALPSPVHLTRASYCVLTSWSASTALTCSWFSRVWTEPSSKITLVIMVSVHREQQAVAGSDGVPYWKPLIREYSWPILPPWSRACCLALLCVREYESLGPRYRQGFLRLNLLRRRVVLAGDL